jgi:uncharacterized protein
MDAQALVLAILNDLPGRKIQGRTRLQKLAFFAVESGASSDVSFSLHNYGPFSLQVAQATELLSLMGEITEEEIPLGPLKRYKKVYSLPNPAVVSESLPARASKVLHDLNRYSTIELEIASTVRYFLTVGLSPDDAIRETKKLKPSKAQATIVGRAEEALRKADLYEGKRAHQMPNSQPN